ncbi:ATP-binding protein [Actinoplanes sp. NPDC049118]|uniref:ATP-binding protein n=1 Tax=Actinoplanes sp. NPDC049118 TaxID=3155769 RepID=UPI00340946AB
MTDGRQIEIIAWSEADRARLYGAPRTATVAEALRDGAFLLRQPFDRRLADLRVGDVDLVVRMQADISLDEPLYRAVPVPRQAQPPGRQAPAPSAGPPPPAREAVPSFPEQLNDRSAVGLAYAAEIETIASFLRQGLSVLVSCEKLVVEQLGPLIAERSGRQAVVLDTPPEDSDPGASLMMPRSQRQRQLARLRELLRELKDGMFLIVPHADLLAGGPDNQLNSETREVVELLYNHSEHVVLAFADPSIGLPEVLASRFTARIGLAGSPRTVPDPVDSHPRLLGEVLVTRPERELFQGYDPDEFHKHVAGLNPIRVRQAMRYAFHQHRGREKPTGLDLFKTIRGFKAQMSASFEVPNVSFDDIGGYHEVKKEIDDALKIMQGTTAADADEELLQSDLIPRGFIFHGPPGTGKTLFAKAIANRLNATIMVVSGPEVTDKYVGEGERKIRELFAEARRNAPSVIVFDEFDAIAGRRTGRDDGGSRAGNAMVAQLLTELDGFREQVPFLVVGTTNQLTLIDPALLRPSRFRGIRIGEPDRIARRAIIEVHARRFKIDLAPQLIDLMVDATELRSGDDIQSLLRDAYVGQKLHGRPAGDSFVIGELVGRMNRAIKEHRESSL